MTSPSPTYKPTTHHGLVYLHVAPLPRKQCGNVPRLFEQSSTADKVDSSKFEWLRLAFLA
jgi:hypothetical protein